MKTLNEIKKAAKLLNDQHIKTAAGFYGLSGGRYFAAKVINGGLFVSPDHGKTWTDQEKRGFRDHNGRALITF